MVTEPATALVIGTLIDGKFRVTREIGRGGMAQVFEAENVDIGKRVAVKVLSKDLAHSKVVTERFIREARAAAKIRSPYICDVFDVGAFDGLPFLVMELLEGESLYERLSREHHLSVDEVLRIAGHIAKGLQKAHDEGIVHRDLKPENILLTVGEDGGTLAKIVDFGLAKFYEPNSEGVQQSRITREGALFGTPAYMSPEQARAQGEVDHRCDLWAFACIVYEMLVGKTVWNLEQGVAMILAQIASAPLPRPSLQRDDLPKGFDQWFEHALDRQIESRFQSAKEAMEVLKVALLLEKGTVKESSISSEAEGLAVDALVAGTPQPEAPVSSEATGAVESTAARVSEQPGPRKWSVGRTVSWSLFVLVLLAGGKWVADDPRHAQAVLEHGLSLGESYLGLSTPTITRSDNLAERADYAQKINHAQEALRAGNLSQARSQMEAAFNMGKPKAARSLLTQLSISLSDLHGRCQLTALGHPRPFDASSDGSIPTLGVTGNGVVAVWADGHEQADRIQAYAALLDPALRRMGPALSVTPEARSVRSPQLAQSASQLGLLYWDYAGDQPGVYVRALTADGRIAGAATLISSSTAGAPYNPTFAADPDGTFWAVWSESVGSKTTELFALHLSGALKPLGDKVKLTEHPPEAGPVIASMPAIAVDHDTLNVAFRVQRGNDFELLLLRAHPKSPQFLAGLDAPPAASSASSAPVVAPVAVHSVKSKAHPRAAKSVAIVEEPAPRYLGQIVKLSKDASKQSVPKLACNNSGCYVGWDAENAGAQIGYVRAADDQLMWYREVSSKSSRPSVASGGQKTLACWFEDGKVKVGQVTTDGIAEGTTVARASGQLPSSDIRYSQASDTGPGHQTEWFLAWRDYEAAEHEPFIARVECR